MGLHTNDQLVTSSAHLIYHVRMYVDTFLWLQKHSRPEVWDTVRNAVVETHLVHSRILIHFVQRDRINNLPKKPRRTDVVAVDYFDHALDFQPSKNEFLTNLADEKIGGQLVHLTTKSSLLKSEQEWRIGETAKVIAPVLQDFLSVVSVERFPKKDECKGYVNQISSWLNSSVNPFTSVSPTT